MANPHTLILFDLDGTVLDTEYEISAITADVLRDHGYNLNTDTIFARYGGMGFLAKFNKIAADQGRTFSENELEAIMKTYDGRKKALYSRDGLTAVSGIQALLRRLAADENNLLAIGSSNKVARSQQGLKSGHLSNYFSDRIYGPDIAGGLPKPDPAVYLLGMRANGFSPAQTIVVDDSEAGIKAGHAAGAFVVAYLDPRFGDGCMTKREQFSAAGADLIISSFDELESQVRAVRPSLLPVPQ